MPEGPLLRAILPAAPVALRRPDPVQVVTVKSPKSLGGTSASIVLYVEDVDAVVKQAVDVGATVTMEVEDQFWGDRFGTISDPFGHTWSVATHIEDLTLEEIAERGKAAMAAMSS